jgi:uncharacterized protein YlxP (DUF503 family)
MNTILIAIPSFLCVSFALSYIGAKNELKQTKKILDDLIIANQKFLKSSLSQIDDQDMHKENFIKFLSESRDWAYEYIEMSQATIKEVIDELNKKNIKESTNKLMALLPEVPNE